MCYDIMYGALVSTARAFCVLLCSGVMGDVVKVLYLLNKKPSAVQMPPDGLRLLSWCEQILQRYLRGASQDSKGGPQADCATVSTSSTVAGHGKLDFSTLDEAIRFYCDLGPADSTCKT